MINCSYSAYMAVEALLHCGTTFSAYVHTLTSTSYRLIPTSHSPPAIDDNIWIPLTGTGAPLIVLVSSGRPWLAHGVATSLERLSPE